MTSVEWLVCGEEDTWSGVIMRGMMFKLMGWWVLSSIIMTSGLRVVVVMLPGETGPVVKVAILPDTGTATC